VRGSRSQERVPPVSSKHHDAFARAYQRGIAAEKKGHLDEAAAAFAEALRLDPEDHGGVSIRLAVIGRGRTPAKAPEAYVATLFDQRAGEFDEMLVEKLGYSLPMLLREKLLSLGLGPWRRMLDLGCGTGLTGASLADMAGEITGVDLSEGMLQEASEREVYSAFYLGDVVAFLNETESGAWDLLTATDVLPYLGALDEFFQGAGRALTPGGVLAISVETLPEMEQDYMVGPKHRFAHRDSYLHALSQSAGFEVLECAPVTLRHDKGAPVSGLLLLARRR